MSNIKTPPKGKPGDRLLGRLRQAFHDLGYEKASMVGLAEACGVTRRALYHHFSSKEDAYRTVLAWQQDTDIEAGLAAGGRVLAAGGGGLDVILTTMDARYAESHRRLARSPHAAELNYVTFRSFRDVVTWAAATYQKRLADLLSDMAGRGVLRLRPDVTPAVLSQLLCDAARGVNQSLPAQPADSLAQRYRGMFLIILRGATMPVPDEQAMAVGRSGGRVR